jgi:glutaredoxin
MNSCPFCEEIKTRLTEGDVEFTEVMIDKDVKNITKADSVPILLVGKQFLVPERSFRTIKEAFDITKKLLDGKL